MWPDASLQEKNTHGGCLRVRCLEQYLDLRARKQKGVGKKITLRGTSKLYFALITKYWGDQTENEVSDGGKQHSRKERNMYKILLGKTWSNHLGNLVVDGWIILRWIIRKLWYDSMEWIQISKNTVQWWALVNIIINCYVQK